jgi:hypothetical protein
MPRLEPSCLSWSSNLLFVLGSDASSCNINGTANSSIKLQSASMSLICRSRLDLRTKILCTTKAVAWGSSWSVDRSEERELR